MKTLEEFAIEEIQHLRRKENILKKENDELKELNNKQQEEIFELKNKFIELISNFKHDFGIRIETLETISGSFVEATEEIWEENNKEKYEYYKKIFALEEKKPNNCCYLCGESIENYCYQEPQTGKKFCKKCWSKKK